MNNFTLKAEDYGGYHPEINQGWGQNQQDAYIVLDPKELQILLDIYHKYKNGKRVIIEPNGCIRLTETSLKNKPNATLIED